MNSITLERPYFLRTKFYRPSLPEDYILRPRLLAQLERISQYQLAVITAPAGYGKTTLASAWIEQVDCPNAWLSLDQGDNDLVVFIGYFVAAIRTIFPEFGEALLPITHTSSRPPLSTINRYLLNELDQLDQNFVLVLDDFHLLTNPDIHQFLAGFFPHPLPHFHLILVSRYDPPQQLMKLRAQSRLVELRARDLRFSTIEVADFVEKALPVWSDPDTVKKLAEKTEGWPVGLRLATIAIRRWGIEDHRPNLLHVENEYIIEYLVNEVLARQPVTIRNFLLKSSILSRFSASLCAAVLGTDSLDSKILPQLEREGLLIESLDNHKQWYRYHQLFRDLLRHRLEEKYPAADVAALHLRASNWLSANNFIEDALDHALTSGNMLVAANTLSAQGVILVNKERWLLLEKLLNKFPPAVINEDIKLFLLLAWLNLYNMRLGKLEPILQHLEAKLSTASLTSAEMRFLNCSIYTFSAIKHNWATDYEKAIFYAHKASAFAQPEWGLVYAYIWIHLSTASHQLKGGKAGIEVLAEENHLVDTRLNRIRKQIAIGFVDWMSGDLSKLLYTTQNGLEMAQGLRLFSTESMLGCLAGSACYARNDLDMAEQYFTAVLNMQYGYLPHAFIYSAIGQALIYQARNMIDDARAMSETAVNFCLEMEHPLMLFIARAFQAELSAQHQRLDKAGMWITETDVSSLSELMPYLYQPQMTPAKIWLAEGTPVSLRQAEIELLRLHDIVTTVHNIPCQIQVLALQSLLYQAQNKAEASKDTLVQAVRLAQHGGFIRIFVDLGPKMATALKHLYIQGYAPNYVQQILEAFPVFVSAPNSTPPLALIESLTEREMEVLGLLAQRLSNKEISRMLVISTETVKRHASNIYQKLQVKNRRQAVAKAYSLNLLVDLRASSIGNATNLLTHRQIK